MAQWIARKGHRAGWVSVDQRDNDPVVLLTYIAAVLDQIQPIDPELFQALAAPGASVLGTVVPRLLSVVSSMTQPVALVLDHLEALENQDCPGRGCEAHLVVVQLPGPGDLEGAVGEGLGLDPVLACDRDQGALGQGGRGGGQGADVGGELGRLGQDGVGTVGLPGQDIGDTLQEQGGRRPRAPRGPARRRRSGRRRASGPRRCGTAARAAAPARAPWRWISRTLSRPARARRRPPSVRCPPAGRPAPTGRLPGWRPADSAPPARGRRTTGTTGGRSGRVRWRRCGRRGFRPAGLPGRRPRRPGQFGAEQVAEQVVVVVPLALSVQGNAKRVGALPRLQGAARPPRIQGGVAERPAGPVEQGDSMVAGGGACCWMLRVHDPPSWRPWPPPHMRPNRIITGGRRRIIGRATQARRDR